MRLGLINIVMQLIFNECRAELSLRGKSDYGNGFLYLDGPGFDNIYPVEKRIAGDLPSEKLTWDNVVIIMMTFNDKEESKLIQKHFDVWISRMPKGLDVLFVTDSDDERTYDEVLPDSNNVDPTIHLYRSPQTNEGAQARSKTIDSLSHAYELFKDSNKEMFLKIDPDTFIIPENLLNRMVTLHEKTYPQPVDFGRVDCARERNCYSLGASYGLNKNGLKAILEYIENDPQIFDREFIEGKIVVKNRMLDEDFFTSYVFQRATGYPTIHISGVSIRLFSRDYIIRGPREEEWDETENHITIHLAKTPSDFEMLEDFYYDEQGKLRQNYDNW